MYNIHSPAAGQYSKQGIHNRRKVPAQEEKTLSGKQP
jgi:hypothetical protein